MSKIEFNKAALTIGEQMSLLRSRGLIINDEIEVRHYLNHISYYHLSGYFKPFQKKDNLFYWGVSFKDILNLYFFDRKLRLLFLNALERIEKSFKAQFVYHLSVHHGPYCLTDDKEFKKHKEKINHSLKISKEPFIKNFREKYLNEHPPLWILAEVLSFGEIINLFRSLKSEDKKSISKLYGIGWLYLYSWLENLREIRNICAHHSRLWNKKITKHLKKGKEYPEIQYKNYIFDSIIITNILLKKVSPTFDWLNQILLLIDEYSVDVVNMGFPENWREIFNEILNNAQTGKNFKK